MSSRKKDVKIWNRTGEVPAEFPPGPLCSLMEGRAAGGSGGDGCLDKAP